MDCKLGIHTRGLIPVSVPGSEDSVTLPYGDIMRVLSVAGLNATDVFVDIGCGKGRVVCCASLSPVREVIGIDHAPEMCVLARKNVSRLLMQHSPIRILNVCATGYDYSEGSVFYLYNPFDAVILDNVLGKIRESLNRKMRPVTIIYANPVHEHSLSACPWLSMVERWEAMGSRGLAVPVSFWKSGQ